MEKKIGFIGGGAMAEAILSGAVSKQVLAAENIFVSDHKEERCRFLQDSYYQAGGAGNRQGQQCSEYQRCQFPAP